MPDRGAVRVGMGFDAHAFAPPAQPGPSGPSGSPESTARSSRPLVLGGVRIGGPGLAGWSDADVVAHAVGDALLGAANLGDLGAHFPQEAVADGESSLSLLRQVAVMVDDAGYAVANIDCVVIAQSVRISPHRAAMAAALAAALGLDPAQVSVKATSTDRMGFTGRGEGIAATAVALLERLGGS